MTNGKWVNSKIPEDKRLCHFCEMQEVESEIHFLLTCPLYSDQREAMLDAFGQNVNHFRTMDKTEKFITIMETKNTSLIKETAKFVHSAFTKRSENTSEE